MGIEIKAPVIPPLESISAKPAGKTGPLSEDKKIAEAAKQFESMLVHQMFQSMWSSVQSDGMLSGSREEELFRDMFNQALADSMVEGQGLGIKDIVAREMMKKKQ